MLTFVMWLVGIISALAIGGAFISGTFTNGVILSWLPLIAHKVVGWIIIASTLIGALAAAMK